jgi:hypothetical protein
LHNGEPITLNLDLPQSFVVSTQKHADISDLSRSFWVSYKPASEDDISLLMQNAARIIKGTSMKSSGLSILVPKTESGANAMDVEKLPEQETYDINFELLSLVTGLYGYVFLKRLFMKLSDPKW